MAFQSFSKRFIIEYLHKFQKLNLRKLFKDSAIVCSLNWKSQSESSNNRGLSPVNLTKNTVRNLTKIRYWGAARQIPNTAKNTIKYFMITVTERGLQKYWTENRPSQSILILIIQIPYNRWYKHAHQFEIAIAWKKLTIR